MLLAFIPAVLVFFLALLAPNKRLIWMVSVLVATLSIIFLLVDSRVFSMFKFHLKSTIFTLIFSRQWGGIFDLSHYEFILILASLFFIIICECVLALLVWKIIIVPGRYKIGKTISTFWLGATLFCYFTLMLSIANSNNLFSQQTPNLPFYNQLFAYVIPARNAEDILLRYSEHHFSQPLFANDPLNYPLHPMQCKKPEQPLNIILIMIDSLRFDALQPRYMPNASQFRSESSEFFNYLSAGNSTQPGVFSLFYSLPANYWTAALMQEKSPVLMDLLQESGYSMRILWSADKKNPPFTKTVYRNVEGLEPEEAPGADVGERDRSITKQALQFLAAKQTKPFFLHLLYNAAHGYCQQQSFPDVFQPVINQCARIAVTNDTDPVPYRNRYLNAVYFIDQEVGKLLQLIKEKGYLQNSIVIITSDHGQEFNDNQQNYWDHAGNFTRAQVQVPLLIHWPGDPLRKIHYLTSSYDLVPTLLQRLFTCKNPVSDYSIGQNLLQEGNRLPFILAGSYVNMGIITADSIITLETSGRITMTGSKAEPLANGKPDMQTIHQALLLMRAYYRK